MAEKEAHGGGSHPSGKALRFLFASGILGHHGGGKGKGGKVTYHKGKSQSLGGLKKRAGNGTSTFRAKTANARVKGLGAKAAAPRNAPGNRFGRSAIGGKTAHLRSGSAPPKADHSATRAARVAAGKAQAMKHPLVKGYAEGPHGLAGLKMNQKSIASGKASFRAQAAAKKVAVAKAHESYTKALIRANRSLLDDKAQRTKKRTYDTLIRTISDGSKSRQGAYKSEIDSALRRSSFAARKAK